MCNPIVIVGSFNQDLTWYCGDFPKPGETSVGKFATGPGGKGSNQAVAAARTGIPTTFVGAIGNDVFGDAVRRFYEAEGINHQLVVYPDTPTGNAGIFVSESGENEIIVALGANLRLASEDIAESILKNAEIVVCQNEIRLETTSKILQRASRHGGTTVLNPAPLTPQFSPEYLDHVDILIPNETEFVQLSGQFENDSTTPVSESDLRELSGDALHKLCRRIGVDAVILTLGGKGCFVSTANSHQLIPAYRDIEVVDTTGAGDAFVGGFSSGMVQFDKDILKAAAYGNAVAALSATKHGTARAMPSKQEIDAFFLAKRQDNDSER